MPTPILVKCSLTNVSGLPEDACTTDWAFNAADASDAEVDDIFDALVAFWNGGSDPQLADFVSTAITRVAQQNHLDAYDLTGHLDGSPHGSPIRSRTWTMGAVATGHTNWPSEVAVALSLAADGFGGVPETEVNPSPPPATIRPRARYRGRLYLGPWTGNTGESTTGDPRPTSSSFLTALDAAVTALITARPDWSVWSRADAVLREIYPLGEVTVDNAYDTIRKRGVAATSRTHLWP